VLFLSLVIETNYIFRENNERYIKHASKTILFLYQFDILGSSDVGNSRRKDFGAYRL
jgi:hypothetical protein